jgi:lipopolysaccharide transport system permease protein
MARSIVLKAERGWARLDLVELWEYRGLLLALAVRDIRLRYRQTMLGVAWVVIQPLISAGVFSFVFGSIAKLPSDGVPYLVFAFSGLTAWNLATNVLTRASASLVNNSNLVSKIYFPRLILPLSGVPSALLDFAVAGAVLAGLLAAFGVKLHVGLLLMPVWLVILVSIALGLGICAGALSVKYRDVNYIVPVALNLVMFLSPITYSTSALPTAVRDYYYLNPIAGVIEAVRWSLLGIGHVSVGAVLYSALAGLALLLSGAFVFRRLEREFADVI